MGLPKPSREAKFTGANRDREIFIFPVQLTTSRIGNHTRLMPSPLSTCVTIHTYIRVLKLNRDNKSKAPTGERWRDP